MVKVLVRLIGVVLIALSVSAVAADQKRSAVVAGSKAAGMDTCVAPTPFMRRNHFELIKHQRDITVHQGIRQTDDSLAGCIDCHAATDAHGKPVPANADEQFCSACHEYTAVTFDCFSCHSAVPTKTGN